MQYYRSSVSFSRRIVATRLRVSYFEVFSKILLEPNFQKLSKRRRVGANSAWEINLIFVHI
jgi:hypothetical protein